LPLRATLSFLFLYIQYIDKLALTFSIYWLDKKLSHPFFSPINYTVGKKAKEYVLFSRKRERQEFKKKKKSKLYIFEEERKVSVDLKDLCKSFLPILG
jgi:hypothetical protein